MEFEQRILHDSSASGPHWAIDRLVGWIIKIGKCEQAGKNIRRGEENDDLRFILFIEDVDEATYRRRLSVCRSCPILYKPLFTCGSPLALNQKDLNPQPCYCNMEAKALAKDATCYIDDTCGTEAPENLGWKEIARETQ